jgi:hypothetical protein
VLFKYCGGGQIAPPPIYSKKATNSEPQSDKGEEEESVPQDSAKMSEKAIDVAELPQQTADGFTQSIIKMIPHIASKVGITLVSIPKVGICCRFNAIEAFPEQGISVEDVIGFCKSLETAVRSVHTLALSRVVFQKGVASHPRLRYLEFPASLSVGFIQCLPEAIANKSELTMDEVNSVNRLNYDLSRNLSHRNQEAFACYQHGNFSCVQLKSVPPGTTIHELMEILYEVVDEMESGRKNMEDMSSLVMKGIKEAEKELEEQKLKKLEEEGVLRNVPLVGSVLGWLYPTSPVEVGRTFNIQEGSIQTTAKVIQHNMQVNLFGSQSSASGDPNVSGSQDTTTEPEKEEKNNDSN